jgi:ATP-dependent Clp protease ATP-binding subunit ClpB
MDMNRLTQRSQKALQQAQEIATRLGHQQVDGEHLPLALISDPDGLAPRLLELAGADVDALAADLDADLDLRPKVSGTGQAAGQIYVSQRLKRLLDAAEREARRLKDEYVSIEHLLLGLVEEGGTTGAGRLLAKHAATRDAVLGALTQVRGNQRVTSATPEGSYEALEKYGRDLVEDARAGGRSGQQGTAGGTAA